MEFKQEQANKTYKFLVEELDRSVEALEKQWRRENPKAPKSTLMIAMSVFRFERLQVIINTAEDIDIKERTLAGNIAAHLIEKEMNEGS